MKKTLLFTACAVIVAILISAVDGTNLHVKPPKEKTGAPGDGTCSDCHIGAGLNLGPGNVQVAFSGKNNTYKLNKSYTITVTVTDPSEFRFGFETVSLDPNNNQAGKATITDTTYTILQKDNSNGRKYVSNYTASDKYVWTYKWKAPDTNVGNITFYVAGNATNWDDSPNGDNVYTSSLTVTPSSSRDEQLADISEVNCYPNPINTQRVFTASYALDQSAMVAIQLLDIKGQQVEELLHAQQDQGAHQQQLQIHQQVTPGVYFLVIRTTGEPKVQKVVIQ